MAWHAYYIEPIDWGWSHLKTIDVTLAEIATGKESDKDPLEKDIRGDDVRHFLDAWDKAKEEAKKIGWEGDFRAPPRVFWIPSEQYMEYGFVFKQENNGDTIVVSPKKMSWLKDIRSPHI